jgi:hypothetical protein
LLEALFDVTPAEVKRFISARLGPDNLPDTDDDRHFASLAEVRAVLDVPQPNYNRGRGTAHARSSDPNARVYAWVGGLERHLTIIRGPGLFLLRER